MLCYIVKSKILVFRAVFTEADLINPDLKGIVNAQLLLTVQLSSYLDFMINFFSFQLCIGAYINTVISGLNCV